MDPVRSPPRLPKISSVRSVSSVVNHSASMSADYFSAGSLDYVRYRPRYPEAWFDWLVARCAARNLAWDCACGSGQATEELAKRFGKVVGTDASEGQLRSAPAIPNVEWKLARGEDSGLEAGSVDLVTVAQALHWFELERFWDECRRGLRPEIGRAHV